MISNTEIDVRRWADSGVIGVAVAALAAKDDSLRSMAYGILASYSELLQVR